MEGIIHVSFDIEGLLRAFTAAWTLEMNSADLDIKEAWAEEGHEFWIEPHGVEIWTEDLMDRCKEEAERYYKLTDLKPSKAKLVVGMTEFNFLEK